MFLLSLIFASSCLGPFSQKKAEMNIRIDTTGKTKLSYEQISAMLEKLAQSEAPKELSMGAMCYKQAGPPRRAEYICPDCGHRTLYTEDKAAFITRSLPTILALLHNLQAIDLTLDQSQFCKKCKPEIEDPQIGIKIHYSDTNYVHEYQGLNDVDLELIRDFLEGKNEHLSYYDRGTPLKNYIPRLEQVLGVKLKKE